MTVLSAGVGFTDWDSGKYNVFTMSSKFVSIFILDINWSSCESDNGNKSKQAGCRLEYCSQDFSVLQVSTFYTLLSEDLKTLLNVLDIFCFVLLSV